MGRVIRIRHGSNVIIARQEFTTSMVSPKDSNRENRLYGRTDK